MPSITDRKSIDVHGGGRGGAGNISNDSGSTRQYVDGGLYRTESPGANGQPYSTGRGGAGNIGEGREDPTRHPATDEYAQESLLSGQAGGGPASGGRGGAGNIGEIKSQDKLHDGTEREVPTSNSSERAAEQAQDSDQTLPYGPERTAHLEQRRQSNGMSHLGLADKMKYGILGMMKKD